MGVITYNGLNSTDYGIQVATPPGYQMPALDIELTHVPGRNGDIPTYSNSYKNVKRKYEVNFGKWLGDFQTQVDKILEWLHSTRYYSSMITSAIVGEQKIFNINKNGIVDTNLDYAELYDTYDKKHYRYAMLDSEIDIDNILSQAGSFDLEFNCKPYRYLISGQNGVEFRYDTTVQKLFAAPENPTKYTAEPYIVIYEAENNTGNTEITVITTAQTGFSQETVIQSFTVSAGYGSMVIFTDDKYCVNPTTNEINTQYVSTLSSNKWPVLYPGANQMVVSGGCKEAIVVPNWREL